MLVSDKFLDHSIQRQLINPSLSIDLCERIIAALDKKSIPDKEKLLFSLKENMNNYKESAKDFVSDEVYEEFCDSIKKRIQQCENYFKVTLSDILLLTESTAIKPIDVGWDYISPQSIAETINEYVIGQQEYTNALALCSYLHLLKCKDDKADLPKMNLMVYGPSGVGKTYGAQMLAKKLSFDFAIVNSNLLVQEGIVGECVPDAITHAYIKNPKMTHVMLFFDEFDKLYKDGDYNEKILQEILCIFDDNSDISFRTSFAKNAEYKKIPTRNIMIIIGGVFDMLEPIVNKRMCQVNVGYNSGSPLPKNEFYQHITKEDFSKLFCSDELLGRIGQFVRVESMTTEMLLDIMHSEMASPLIQYQNFFASHNCHIDLTEDAAKMIVDVVEKQNLGVRGLKSVLGSILKEEMMLVNKNTPHTITIDEAYVASHLN